MSKPIVCIATEMCFRDGRRYRAGQRVVVSLAEGEKLPKYLVPKEQAKAAATEETDNFEGAGLNSKSAEPVDSTGLNAPLDAPESADDNEGSESSAEAPAASDAAKALASENGIDLGQIEGTGADGNITKGDVQKFMDGDAI